MSACLADGRYGVDLGFASKTHMGGSVGGGHASGSTFGNIIGGVAAAGALIGLGAGIGAAIGSGSSTGDGTLYYGGTGTWVGSSTGSQTTPTTSPGETGTGTPIAQPVEGTLPQPELEKFTTKFQPVELPGDKFIPFEPSLIEFEPKDEWIAGATTYDGTLGGLKDSTLTSSGTLTEDEVITAIGAKAKEKGVSEDEYLEMLKKFTGIATYEELKDKDKYRNTITIGRAANKYGLISTKANGAIPFYKEVADNGGYMSFFSEDFEELVKTFSKAIEVADYGLVLWGIFLNYDFLMCTNPYYYIPPYNALKTVKEFKKTDKIGGMAYTMELSTIRTFGYKNICEDSPYSVSGANLDTVDFEENYYSWGTIPCPGDFDNWFSYFTPCRYRVTR